jgi:hypothetical protein
MLTLRRLNLADRRCLGSSIFATQQQALEHLCDHVLTRPEADYWARLIPAYADHVDPDSDDGLFHFARSLWSEHPPAKPAQALYAGYADAIEQAAADALRLGWFWQEDSGSGPSWHGIGLSGLYLVWYPHAVATAFLIGYAAPPPEAKVTAGRRRTDPLPRQNSWIYYGAALRHSEKRFPPLAPDDTVALYHLFKKCAVRVRKAYKHACLAGKVVAGEGDLGSLRAGVPDLGAWQQLRATAPCPLTPCLRS